MIYNNNMSVEQIIKESVAENKLYQQKGRTPYPCSYSSIILPSSS